MSQLDLFTLPTRRAFIRERAAVRQAEEERAKDRRRFDREFKLRSRPTGEATCCLYWYPQSNGWRCCVKCQRPLIYG